MLKEILVELQSIHLSSPHDIVRFNDLSSLIVYSHLLFLVDALLLCFLNSVILACIFSKLATFSPNAIQSLSVLKYETGNFFDFNILCCCNTVFRSSESSVIFLFILSILSCESCSLPNPSYA